MRLSEYLKLWLPEDTDPVKVSDLTENFEVLDERIGSDNIRVVTGSYTGTGASGSGNKNTLTFPFSPKILIVTYGGPYRIVAVSGNTTAHVGDSLSVSASSGESGGGDRLPMKVSLDRKYVTISLGATTKWYSDSAVAQLNSIAQLYHYSAIG